MVKLQLIGHLGQDAQINQVNGKQVLNFSICHTEKFKDAQGNQKEKSLWVNCSYFTESKIGPYLKRGTQIYCEGKPDVKLWTDRNNNPQVQQTMIVSSVQLLGGNKGEASSQQSTQSTSSYTVSAPPDITEVVDDLPF